MKTRLIALFAVLPVTLLAGCGAPETTIDERAEASAQAIGGFTFDASAVATTPPAALPEDRLTTAAFASASVEASLLGTDEPFALVGAIGSRVRSESAAWAYEVDPATGQVLALRKTAARAPAQDTDTGLDSMDRLGSFGIPASEIGEVAERQTFFEEEDGRASSGPQLHRNKTFVIRAINGVRVEGHRAVITHTPDGAFHRALVRWPALAASGHALRTNVGGAELQQRAVESLVAAARTGGHIRLAWKYVPTLQPSGEVTLRLMATALVPGGTAEGGVSEEAQEIDVDVDAFE